MLQVSLMRIKNKISILTLAIYTPDQNPFADGAVPIMSVPGVMDTLQRVPIVPANMPPAAL